MLLSLLWNSLSIKVFYENEKQPMTIEKLEKMFSEKKYRNNLYDALAKLRKAYDAVAQKQVKKQMKKQLNLI